MRIYVRRLWPFLCLKVSLKMDRRPTDPPPDPQVLVYWFLGVFVSRFLGSWLLGFKFLGFLVSWFLGFNSPGLLVSTSLGFEVAKIYQTFISCFQEDIDLVSKIFKILLDGSSGFVGAHLFHT